MANGEKEALLRHQFPMVCSPYITYEVSPTTYSSEDEGGYFLQNVSTHLPHTMNCCTSQKMAIAEYSLLLRNPQIHPLVHNYQPLNPTLSQTNLVRPCTHKPHL